MIRKGLTGFGSAAIVVLLARQLAYAAEPGPAARLLEQRAGGPALPFLALVSLSIGAVLAIAVCSLAALAVRERALVQRRSAAPFPVRRTLAVACALTFVTCLGGGLLEAYLHWRAGLGWHGVHCLFGPVHRELVPIETALSLVAAALLAAARHVGAWMRRTFSRLVSIPPCARTRVLRAVVARSLHADDVLAVPSARAPPVLG